MKFLPLLKTCIKALVRNPMRAALTILGIIIGIAAVIAMVEIGQGSTLQIKNTIASMGADTLNIRPGAISKSGVNTGAGGRASLTNADCEAIAKDCPMVLRATPVVRASGQVIYGNKNWSPETVEGGSVEYLKIKSWYDMDRGQPFSEEDVEQARRVCVIGQTVARELFGDEDPLGKDIRIKNVMFKVIGILQKKGANMMGRDQDDSIILPWTSIRYRLQGLGGGSASTSSGKSTTTFNRADKYTANSVDYYTETTDQPYTDAPHPRRFNNIDSIMAQIADPERSSEAIDQITEVIRAKHNLKDGQLDDFRVWDMAEMSRRHEQHHGGNDQPADDRGHDLPGRRRRGHHEHHARLRHGAHQGNRPAHGGGRPSAGHHAPVPAGSGSALRGGRRAGHRARQGHLHHRQPHHELGHRLLPGSHGPGGGRLRVHRPGLRMVSVLEGVQDGPHRRPATRITPYFFLSHVIHVQTSPSPGRMLPELLHGRPGLPAAGQRPPRRLGGEQAPPQL